VVELITEEVEELEPFSLQCTALNLPKPIISWLKDNSLLAAAGFDTSERVSINESVRSDYLVVNTLTLHRAEAGVDDGQYQCRIDNANATSVIFDSVEVNVRGKPLEPHRKFNGFVLSIIHVYNYFYSER